MRLDRQEPPASSNRAGPNGRVTLGFVSGRGRAERERRGWLQAVRGWLSRAPLGDRDSPSEAVRLRAELLAHSARGHFEDAADAARRLVLWQRKAYGENHPACAEGLNNVAYLLRKVGDDR